MLYLPCHTITLPANHTGLTGDNNKTLNLMKLEVIKGNITPG
jgi:hypothetical protein